MMRTSKNSKAEIAKTECRTPTEGREGVTRIPTWKYNCVREAILTMVGNAGADGLAFSKLTDAVRSQLTPEQLGELGSLGWHVVTVKLNMEDEGELLRLPGSPQRLVLSA